MAHEQKIWKLSNFRQFGQFWHFLFSERNDFNLNQCVQLHLFRLAMFKIYAISKSFFLHGQKRVRITISCRMMFDDYPLDAHTCQFQVGSCKFNISFLYFCQYFIFSQIISDCHFKVYGAWFTRYKKIQRDFERWIDIQYLCRWKLNYFHKSWETLKEKTLKAVISWIM